MKIPNLPVFSLSLSFSFSLSLSLSLSQPRQMVVSFNVRSVGKNKDSNTVGDRVLELFLHSLGAILTSVQDTEMKSVLSLRVCVHPSLACRVFNNDLLVLAEGVYIHHGVLCLLHWFAMITI